MAISRFVLASLGLLVALPAARAYVEAPMPLGAVIAQSTNIMVVTVEKVDKEKNLIVFKKAEDLKGKHPTDVVKHNIGRGGFHPREWQYIMEWAEAGKTAVFFHNGGASETYIGGYWYQAYPGGEWWNMSHGEPYLFRSFYGKPDKLVAAVRAIVAGQEVIVPCMVDGNKEDLQLRRSKVQRVKASLKIQDYNPKRDFVGWGGEDIRRLAGFPGFSHYAGLSRTDAEAQAISTVDFDGDGKLDVCLVGGGRVVVLQNTGEGFSEASLPYAGGCRAAVWADYNADGKPDLLLATPSGPKLLTNQGNGSFRDDAGALPKEPAYNLTAAAWVDYDADGKPDVLLANGFHGLRLYKNVPPPADVQKAMRPPKLGDWMLIGPFDNAGNRGFDTAFPPEKEVDFAREYKGKADVVCKWQKVAFADGAVQSLARFPNNNDAVAYVCREIEAFSATDLPVSLGSDDTLTVWLNGEKVHAENVYRAAAPDQAKLTLKLKPGKNTLLMKVCQGGGEWAFYFAAGQPQMGTVPWFKDVSAEAGLGPDVPANAARGDSLAVADVNGDGRPDFLYGAGEGMLFVNNGKGYAPSAASGIRYKPGKVGPVFADVDNDGHPDLLVPQADGVKLFRNDGAGRFADVTAKAGLAKPITGTPVGVACGDFDNDGHPDLMVGVLRGSNRYYRGSGDGTFADASAEVGLTQKVFNSQAVALADVNNDGALDLILNNEGQESSLLFGDAAALAKLTPVTLHPVGVGGVVRVLGADGKPLQSRQVAAGEGRGGQSAPVARFALAPGNYVVELRDSTGRSVKRPITVAQSPLKVAIGEGGE